MSTNLSVCAVIRQRENSSYEAAHNMDFPQILTPSKNSVLDLLISRLKWHFLPHLLLRISGRNYSTNLANDWQHALWIIFSNQVVISWRRRYSWGFKNVLFWGELWAPQAECRPDLLCWREGRHLHNSAPQTKTKSSCKRDNMHFRF